MVDRDAVTFTVLAGACDKDLRPRAYETATAVVIGVTYGTDGSAACSADAILKTASLTLTAPVGTRPLLDVATGEALAIDVTGGQSIS